MKAAHDTNRLKVHTNRLREEWTPGETREAARALMLCYRDGEFTCQTFFTQPLVGQLNWIDGLKKDAQVYFREISLIGMNLFHVRLVGKENDVRTMCRDARFYNVLRDIDSTLTEDMRSRWYLETTTEPEHWDVIAAVDERAHYLANHVNLRKTRTRVHNIIVVGDRLVGRTERQEVVIGQLTPDVIEREDVLLDAEPMDALNALGKVDLVAKLPNSDEAFLACIQNRVYHFTLRGDLIRFEELEDRVKRINSVGFNRVRSVLATSNGLYEIDIQEMPNMVRTVGLPRQIVHAELREGFKVAQYIEDPWILGVHPAMAILAKTESEKVICF